MKTQILLLGALLGVNRLPAQMFHVIHPFSYADGAYPFAGVILNGGTLYGATSAGGSGESGTVYKLNTDGSGFAVLRHLAVAVDSTNSDGTTPLATLVLGGHTLYGTASAGGGAGGGTVFKVDIDGNGFTALKHFTNSPDGWSPYGGLALNGDTLWGTTELGGSSVGGTVFKLDTNGSGFSILKNFLDDSGGSDPTATPVLNGDTFYGATTIGGINPGDAWGLIFKINTNGTAYTVLKSFSYVDADGPFAGLILNGNTLYGTTVNGGNPGYGTVFKINTDGSGFVVLRNFDSTPDGQNPYGSLVLNGNTLYGTTERGGTADNGTVYQVNTDGSNYRVIKNFQGSADGALPYAGLLLAGNALYGTTSSGGTGGYGTVFKIDLATNSPIPLHIARLDGRVVLSWTNAVFNLQSASVVTGAYNTVIGAASPYTNSAAGAQQFFRLIAN